MAHHNLVPIFSSYNMCVCLYLCVIDNCCMNDLVVCKNYCCCYIILFMIIVLVMIVKSGAMGLNSLGCRI
jgi:hypothetical protein